VRRAIVLVCVMTLLAAGAYADVFGSALIQRSNSYGTPDTCVGCLFAYYAVPAADVGQTLDDWGFYSDQLSTTGYSITPILFLSLGSNNFEVEGIGTTRTNTAPSTIQQYSFGLVSGSAVLQAGEYLGWRDGTADGSIVNSGTISFDQSGQGVWYAGYGAYNGAIAVGETIGFAHDYDTPVRTYSVDGSTVPEPASILLFGICLLGVGKTLRRRLG
jgi:hypothetical protein